MPSTNPLVGSLSKEAVFPSIATHSVNHQLVYLFDGLASGISTNIFGWSVCNCFHTLLTMHSLLPFDSSHSNLSVLLLRGLHLFYSSHSNLWVLLLPKPLYDGWQMLILLLHMLRWVLTAEPTSLATAPNASEFSWLYFVKCPLVCWNLLLMTSTLHGICMNLSYFFHLVNRNKISIGSK